MHEHRGLAPGESLRLAILEKSGRTGIRETQASARGPGFGARARVDRNSVVSSVTSRTIMDCHRLP